MNKGRDSGFGIQEETNKLMALRPESRILEAES